MGQNSQFTIRTVRELGVLARLVRKSQALRADDLAGFTKVSHTFIRDLERGKETLQLGKALQVLDGLGIHISVSIPPGRNLSAESPCPRGCTPEEREELLAVMAKLLELKRWPTN